MEGKAESHSKGAGTFKLQPLTFLHENDKTGADKALFLLEGCATQFENKYLFFFFFFHTSVPRGEVSFVFVSVQDCQVEASPLEKKKSMMLLLFVCAFRQLNIVALKKKRKKQRDGR